MLTLLESSQHDCCLVQLAGEDHDLQQVPVRVSGSQLLAWERSWYQANCQGLVWPGTLQHHVKHSQQTAFKHGMRYVVLDLQSLVAQAPNTARKDAKCRCSSLQT